MATWVGAPHNASSGGATALTAAQREAWLNGVRDALLGVGLVQTLDTGQLDPATFGTTPAWPGATNAEVGYIMFRFNDAAQSTDPVFIRVSFRRGNNTGIAYIGLTVGQGTNGAGVLTGGVSSHLNIYSSSGSMTNISNYACFIDGSLFFGFGRNSVSNYTFCNWFSVERTRDNTYLLDAQGVSITAGGCGTATYSQGVRFVSPVVAYSASSSFCLVPGIPASTSLLNGDKQLYPHYFNFPHIRQRWSSFTVRQSEFTVEPLTFTAAPYADEIRQFINMGQVQSGPVVCNAGNNTAFTACFRWE